MIRLRTYGFAMSADPANVYAEVDAPVGIVDGDLLLAAVSFGRGTQIWGNADVPTPPDGWSLLYAGTHNIGFGGPETTSRLAVFMKTAMNEPARYMFQRSTNTSQMYSAGIVAYAGVDGLEPIEMTSSAATDLAVSNGGIAITLPKVTASEPGDEIVILSSFVSLSGAVESFQSGDFVGGPYTLSGYAQLGVNANGGLLLARRSCTKPELVAQLQAYDTGNKFRGGESLAIVLRPSASNLSTADVSDRIVSALPRGVERIYDLLGDYGRLFSAIAATLKEFAFDLVSSAREELSPVRSRYCLDEWESILGVQNTQTARHGSVLRRRAIVKSALIAASSENGPTTQLVKEVMAGPFAASSAADVVVMESDREILTAMHSHGFPNDLEMPYVPALGMALLATVCMPVTHGGYIHAGDTGPILELAFDPATFVFFSSSISTYYMTITLRAPGDPSPSQTWSIPGNSIPPNPLVLRPRGLGDLVQVCGKWRVELQHNYIGGLTVKASSVLFVEGLTRDALSTVDEMSGAAVYQWGVRLGDVHSAGGPDVYDPSLLDADMQAARLLLDRITPAHTKSSIITSITPTPDDTSAIPDACIPV